MSANPTSKTTFLKIHGIAQPLSDSERVNLANDLVDMLGGLLWHPGHTLEFQYSSTPAMTTWQGGLDAPLSIRHLDIQAYLKVTTHVGQKVATVNLDDAHDQFIPLLRRGLSQAVMITEVEESCVPVLNDDAQIPSVELDSTGCSGGVLFDDMALGLGGSLPWAMKLKFQSGGDEALSLLRRSTRLKRWLKVVTGINLLEPYLQDLWNEVPLGGKAGQLIRHDFELSTRGSSTGEQCSNVAIIDAHLSGTPAASIANSTVMSITQAGLLLPLFHVGSPWKLAEHSVPFLTTNGQIFAFDPRSNFLNSQCEYVFDPEGRHSTEYHTLINNALKLNKSPVQRMVAIDFSHALNLREEASNSQAKRLNLDLGAAQSVNLMETPLGVYKPTDRVVTDLSCLLEILCDRSLPAFGWYNTSCGLAEDAFRMCSPSMFPKPYYPGVDSLVDSAIIMLGDDHPVTWREIAEQLMNLGFVAEAEHAHSRSLPTLQDVLEVLRSKRFEGSSYGAEEGSRMIAGLERLLASKPAMGAATNLRIDHSDPVTITVDDHLHIEGFSRYTSTMLQYLVARKLATFGLLEGNQPLCDEPFKAYHEDLLNNRFTTRKVSYFGVEKLIGQTRLVEAIQGDVRSARMHGVAISITTREMDQSLKQVLDSCPVFAAFGLGYLEHQKFESAIEKYLDRFGIPQGHRYEDKGFFFRAYTKSEPQYVSQFLRLPS